MEAYNIGSYQGGVNALILLNELPDMEVLIDMPRIGQNCAYYIPDILSRKDLTLTCCAMMVTFEHVKISKNKKEFIIKYVNKTKKVKKKK